MLLLSFALFVEAKPFLEHFEMKKTHAFSSFQFFANITNNTAAVITGTGKVKSAMGTALLLQKYPDIKLIINAGFAGGAEHQTLGDICEYQSIKDNDTSRIFYPDISEKESIPYTSGLCVSNPSTQNKFTEYTVDMESSGFFEAASVFCSPHQIKIYKMISDMQDTGTLDKDKILSLWDTASTKIISEIESLKIYKKSKVFTPKEEELINTYFQNNHHTVSEKIILKKQWANKKIKTGEFIIYN